MKVEPQTTVAELMQRFPGGFAVGPGTPDKPGDLSRILAASSRLSKVAHAYPVAQGNQGYMVVDMEMPIPRPPSPEPLAAIE